MTVSDDKLQKIEASKSKHGSEMQVDGEASDPVNKDYSCGMETPAWIDKECRDWNRGMGMMDQCLRWERGESDGNG